MKDRAKKTDSRSWILGCCLWVCCIVVFMSGCSSGSASKKTAEKIFKAKYSENYQEIIAKGLEFNVDTKKKTASVKSYYDLDRKKFVIPDAILYKNKTYPVTKVEQAAFGTNMSITEVSFGKNLKTLEEDAFYTCPELKTIHFSEGLEKIGRYALGACAFSELKLPKSLKYISDYAFTANENLKKVTFSSGVNKWGVEMFAECPALEEVVFSEGAVSVGKGAFTNNTALKKVTLPKSFREIGAEAFWGCTALTRLELPEGLTTIGENAFSDSGIVELKIPDSVSEINREMLGNMQELKKLIVPEIYLSDYQDCVTDDVELETY